MNLNKYSFYHVIELADGIFTPGEQRHLPAQQNVHNALQSIPLEGKRVLDIGCRDGIFCFAAEKMGAKEVIGIDNDLSPAATEFLIPYFKSNIKMFNLNLYDLTPEKFGKFDVVIFAGVLYHLRYPFWALKLIRNVTADKGHIIIETGILDYGEKHALLHCPIGAESPYEPTSITFFNIKGLHDTLKSLGVTVKEVHLLKARTWWRKFQLFLLRILPKALIKLFIKNKENQKYRVFPGQGLPANRATLICSVINENVNQQPVQYWDGTHHYHSTGTF